MNEPKYCPLLKEIVKCARWCAWYDEAEQQCAVMNIAAELVAMGEVGLTGEIRSVSHMNQRLSEIARLGFKTCILPKSGSEKLDVPAGLTVYRVRNIREAIEVAL